MGVHPVRVVPRNGGGDQQGSYSPPNIVGEALPARVKPLKPRARVEAKHVGSQRSAQPSKDFVGGPAKKQHVMARLPAEQVTPLVPLAVLLEPTSRACAILRREPLPGQSPKGRARGRSPPQVALSPKVCPSLSEPQQQPSPSGCRGGQLLDLAPSSPTAASSSSSAGQLQLEVNAQAAPRVAVKQDALKVQRLQLPVPLGAAKMHATQTSMVTPERRTWLSAASTTLRATTAELRPANARDWFQDEQDAQALASLLAEGDMSEEKQEALATAAGLTAIAFTAAASAAPDGACRQPSVPASESTGSSLEFGRRLQLVAPVQCLHGVDWSTLIGVETPETLSAFEDLQAVCSSAGAAESLAPARRVNINSGGQVFFGLLKATAQEEAQGVVIKFGATRHGLQSEQLAAELAKLLNLAAPSSRVVLKAHDAEEWLAISEAADRLDNAPLQVALAKNNSLLMLQFIPARSHDKEELAWTDDYLALSAHELGRLLGLDTLLGNADRLAVKALLWRGNEANVLWRKDGRCVPIDASIARRPPKLLVQAVDKTVDSLLERLLVDDEVAYQTLLEVVACNSHASSAVERAWRAAASEGQCAVVAQFREGVRQALLLAAKELELFEMVSEVIQDWILAFQEDISEVYSARGNSKTRQLRDVKREADTNDEVRARLSSWQSLVQEKSLALRSAIDDWAEKTGACAELTFHGFLGNSVLNPIADAYELLVRLEQLLSRAKVVVGVAGGRHVEGLVVCPDHG